MTEPRIFRNWIDGAWIPPAADGRIAAAPTSAAVCAPIFDPAATDVARGVTAAPTAFIDGPWASMRAAERGKLLRLPGDCPVERAEDLIALDETCHEMLIGVAGRDVVVL